MRTTLRDIRNFPAEDITSASVEYLAQVLPHCEAEEIAYSVGMYGTSGRVLMNRSTGKLYKITARSTNIFKY